MSEGVGEMRPLKKRITWVDLSYERILHSKFYDVIVAEGASYLPDYKRSGRMMKLSGKRSRRGTTL